MYLQTGYGQLPIHVFHVLTLHSHPRSCFAWDCKCPNQGYCVPVLQTATLQGLTGCKVLKEDERGDENYLPLLQLCSAIFPQCLKQPRSHQVSWKSYQVSWKQPFSPSLLISCSCFHQTCLSHCASASAPIITWIGTSNTSTPIPSQFLHSPETFFFLLLSPLSCSPSLSEAIKIPKHISDLHPSLPTPLHTLSDQGKKLNLCFRFKVCRSSAWKKCRASGFTAVRMKGPTLLTSSKRESASRGA